MHKWEYLCSGAHKTGCHIKSFPGTSQSLLVKERLPYLLRPYNELLVIRAATFDSEVHFTYNVMQEY